MNTTRTRSRESRNGGGAGGGGGSGGSGVCNPNGCSSGKENANKQQQLCGGGTGGGGTTGTRWTPVPALLVLLTCCVLQIFRCSSLFFEIVGVAVVQEEIHHVAQHNLIVTRAPPPHHDHSDYDLSRTTSRRAVTAASAETVTTTGVDVGIEGINASDGRSKHGRSDDATRKQRGSGDGPASPSDHDDDHDHDDDDSSPPSQVVEPVVPVVVPPYFPQPTHTTSLKTPSYNPKWLLVGETRKFAMTMIPKVMCSAIRGGFDIPNCQHNPNVTIKLCSEARKNPILKSHPLTNYTTGIMIR
jgi:hypothetical protein